METVLSGIRSTGNLHLGNYFGALKNFVRMQHDERCFFFIADYHSLTTHPDPGMLHVNVKSVLCEYLAAGLDPDVATIYVQSDVPEVAELSLLLGMHAFVGELERTASFKEKIRKHPELAWVLACNTQFGELSRMTQFKDKSAKHPDNVNIGLLSYPVLMAADILQHRATRVPVGKDQEQHLELTRRFARRFNQLYGVDYFPECQPYRFGGELVKIPGLDGSGKMGKSEGNGIYLSDTDEAIRKKVMKAVTDSGPTAPDSPMPEVIANLFTLLKVVSSPDTVQFFTDKWNRCEIRYGDLKKQLAEDIIRVVAPIRERIRDIAADEAYLARVVKQGAEKARASASATVADVRRIMGIKPF